MDMESAAYAMRAAELQIAQSIREFEQKTGMIVTGMKMKRDEQGIKSVSIKAALPDMK